MLKQEEGLFLDSIYSRKHSTIFRIHLPAEGIFYSFYSNPTGKKQTHTSEVKTAAFCKLASSLKIEEDF